MKFPENSSFFPFYRSQQSGSRAKLYLTWKQKNVIESLHAKKLYAVTSFIDTYCTFTVNASTVERWVILFSSDFCNGNRKLCSTQPTTNEMKSTSIRSSALIGSMEYRHCTFFPNKTSYLLSWKSETFPLVQIFMDAEHRLSSIAGFCPTKCILEQTYFIIWLA